MNLQECRIVAIDSNVNGRYVNVFSTKEWLAKDRKEIVQGMYRIWYIQLGQLNLPGIR